MDIKTILSKDARESRESGITVSFKAKVLSCYESNTKIRQSGRLSDSTGNIRFVIWADSDLPLLNKGCLYYFKNARAKFYKKAGRMEIHLSKYSEIIPPPSQASAKPVRIRKAIKKSSISEVSPSEEKYFASGNLNRLEKKKHPLPWKIIYALIIVIVASILFMTGKWFWAGRRLTIGLVIFELSDYISKHVKETVFTVIRLTAIYFLIGGMFRRLSFRRGR